LIPINHPGRRARSRIAREAEIRTVRPNQLSPIN
jgi:hypothetical protein